LGEWIVEFCPVTRTTEPPQKDKLIVAFQPGDSESLSEKVEKFNFKGDGQNWKCLVKNKRKLLTSHITNIQMFASW